MTIEDDEASRTWAIIAERASRPDCNICLEPADVLAKAYSSCSREFQLENVEGWLIRFRASAKCPAVCRAVIDQLAKLQG